MLAHLTPFDLIALGWFLLCWLGLSLVLDRTRLGAHSLSAAMNTQRAAWMRTMARRELRIVDTSIMAGLQQGTAFFASTSILAIGGSFALMNATEDVLTVFRHLPYAVEMSQAEWETKVTGLLLIYTYAFFKFGWAYRLFNYASMLVGAVPSARDLDSPEATQALSSATQMTILAGRHFNLGLRAFFFAMGYLGWFLGPLMMIITSSLVLIVLIRRQFFSASLKAARLPGPPASLNRRNKGGTD